MTAQIDDTFRYHGCEYAVAGISEGELFDPALLDLEPTAMCTACYRGYQAVFGLSGKRLVLDALHVNLRSPGRERQEGPEINGVKPTGPVEKDDWFNNHYEGIRHNLLYSGGLLLADGFIEELYVHMGFHPAWKYQSVTELVFESGVLKREFDRSEQMAELRARFAESPAVGGSRQMSASAEIAAFIERTFDRTYRI